MLNTRTRKQQGYILVTTVLVVGAIASAIATSMLLLGVGNIRTARAIEQQKQARALADACAEEAIERLVRDDTYAAGDTITLGAGTCTIHAISGTGATNRTIQATGTVINGNDDGSSEETNDVIRKVEVIVANLTPPAALTSWEEVGDF